MRGGSSPRPGEGSRPARPCALDGDGWRPARAVPLRDGDGLSRARDPGLRHLPVGVSMTRDAFQTEDERIQAFLASGPFAVVGASTDRSKYGNKVLRCFQQNGRKVYPINPRAPEIEGLTAYPSLAALPEPVRAISVITAPAATEK